MSAIKLRVGENLLRTCFAGKKKAFFTCMALLFVVGTAIICLAVQRVAALQTISALSINGPRLVIDPGHGGLDGGTSAADGTTESAINLAVALRMQELALLFGEKPVMTRTTEALEYPENTSTIREKKVWDQKQRVALINATENAVLISVHQNYYPDSRPSGAVVLFGTAEGSSALAETAQNTLVSALCPENRRVAAPVSSKIYLMQQISCPAILVECGFLSNPAEAEQLKSADYQTKLAMILLASYFQFTADTAEVSNERENKILLY